MYKDELQTEIAKALVTYSDLDYDVGRMVATIYIYLREKQSQEDTLKYYSQRKGDIPKKYRNPNGKHQKIFFNKEKNGVPELPTTIIIMDHLFPKVSSSRLRTTTYAKVYDYSSAFRYFLTDGVREMTRSRVRASGRQCTYSIYSSVVLSDWGITPKIGTLKSIPDNIKEKASHISKLPFGELYKVTHFDPDELLE